MLINQNQTINNTQNQFMTSLNQLKNEKSPSIGETRETLTSFVGTNKSFKRTSSFSLNDPSGATETAKEAIFSALKFDGDDIEDQDQL